jgi:hypothetical protein
MQRLPWVTWWSWKNLASSIPNLSLFDRLVSLHKASLVNLCRQKPQPRGSDCRVCGWLVGPILLSRSKRDRVRNAC